MRSISILAAVICAGLSAPVALAHNMQVAAAATPAGSSKLEATRTALRELWHGHVVAVRKVVVAGIAKNASAGAKAEADRMAIEAKAKIEEFVARRTKMAEAKIAQAEAQATADVRAAAADAAIAAAEKILTQEAKGPLAGELLAKGLDDVRKKLN